MGALKVNGIENIPEEWHETIQYIAETHIGQGLEIHKVTFEQPRKTFRGPSYLIKFELIPIDAKKPRTIVREFNALKAKRYVEKLKKQPN